MKRAIKALAFIFIFVLLFSSVSPAAAANAGAWRQSGGRWWYEFNKGGYAHSQWIQDKNIWYYFDNEGWMVTGWRKVDGITYYFNPSGAMVTGWQKINNTWYYFDKSGAMKTGWVLYNNKWYFLTSDGSMATGWLTDQGVKYYLNSDGDMVTGWKMIQGNWYFFSSSGAMMTGWIQDGPWYYLDKNGKMLTGWIEYKNNWYYLKSSGAMATGKLTIDGVTYTFTSSGELSYPAAASKSTEVIEEDIAYKTEYQNDYNRFVEEGNKVIRAGSKGERKITYEVTYTFGKETSRSIVSNAVTKDPVNEIISVPKKQHKTETKEETKTEKVAYSIINQSDPTRMKSEPDIVLQEGKTGTRTIVYSVTYKDGIETDRRVKSDSITKQPVDKIIKVATGEYSVSYEKETVTIPYETEILDAPNWYLGEEEIVKVGQNGEKEITYAIKKDCNGDIVSWEVYAETFTKNVVNQVIYRGSFVPVVTYSYAQVPNLPECDSSKRDSSLDAECAEWAMGMAKSNNVIHSGLGHGESVGAWGSMEGVVFGRNYIVISTQDGQTYSGNVSLGSHGGGLLSSGDKWGAGCATRSETQPDGSVVTVYFACARSELN